MPVWKDRVAQGGPHQESSGDPLVDRLLLVRGITTAAEIRDWLDPSPRPVPEPGLLPRMGTALDRTVTAIEGRERIGIFGDYDADGVTSTAILMLALAAATGHADQIVTRLPERAEGYGLTVEAVDAFAAADVSLLIVVDCGTNDVEALGRARELGVDAIVLDHHHVTRDVEPNEVVVNPWLLPAGRGTELTSAGIAYCFAAGLTDRIEAVAQEGDASAYLDLAAIGTIADVGSLTGLNRSIVRDGITELRRTARPGLRELMKAAGCAPETIDADDIAFKLGPRLNAPGRVASPTHALDLLTADGASAARYARKVDDLNQRRKTGMAAILAEATAQVAAGPGGGVPLAVAHGPDWPRGLVGAVTGKLADTFGVPAIVLSDGQDGLSVGSARSAGAFDLFDALERHRDLLERFGGHTRAAGLTVKTAVLPHLTDALTEEIVASGIAMPAPVEHLIDADLEAADLTLATVRAIGRLAPFGTGNPRPLFRLRGARVLQFTRMGVDASHLRVVVGGPGGGIKSVMFGAGSRATELAGRTEIDLLATLGIDTWGGGERLDLTIVDFRPSAG